MCTHFKHFTNSGLAYDAKCQGQSVLEVTDSYVLISEVAQRKVSILEINATKSQIQNKVDDYQADHSIDITNLETNLESYDNVSS